LWLIYEFMPNLSVWDRLICRCRTEPCICPCGTRPLTWVERLNIALGTARGIQFLHAQTPTVFHGDIKSGNILLDKHLEPKIADFGLSRSSAKDHITMTMRSVIGTQVYTPSEYLQSGILDYTVDVHCYGVTMFDLVSGKSPITDVDFNGRTIILKNAMRHSFNDIRQFVDTRPPIQNEHVK